MKKHLWMWALMLLAYALPTNAQTANYSLLRVNGKVNPELKGYWKSIGNGYILDATTDSVLLYSYTTNFCYKEKNDNIEELLNSQARFKIISDTLNILPSDYGDRTNDLQIKHHYVRINGLPKGTLSFSQMMQLPPKVLFNLYIETMQENYAFSKERKMDWVAIRRIYDGKINEKTTNDELFKFIGEVVTLTKDQHTKIISESGKTLQYSGSASATLVGEEFKKQSEIKNHSDYINKFFATSYKNITDSLLRGNGKKAMNGQIEWGSLNKSVGYISVFSFTDFLPKGFTRKQQIDSLYANMEHIINALKDKDAIIIDISFNFGGYDAAMLAVAGFFTNEPVLAYTSQVYNNGKFYNESNVYIRPSGTINYTKPVYLLMTDISRSAAEGFALAMKVLPNVKLVGTNTLGIFSSMLGKSISNFYSTSSNQRLVDPQGRFYEVTGLIPDISLPVFIKGNVFGGHKEAVRSVIKMAEAKK